MFTKKWMCVLALAVLALPLATAPAQAETIIADARANWQSNTSGNTTAAFGGGLGLPDTAGSGYWNYYASTTANPTADGANLTLLSWRGVGIQGNSGYALPHDNYPVDNLPAVSIGTMYATTPAVAANELSWHPGLRGLYAVIRWTAGAAEAGSVHIAGDFVHTGGGSWNTTYNIFVDGVNKASYTLSGSTQPFDVTANVIAGSNVDFVAGDGKLGGDESRITAHIGVVPEPSTQILLGTGLLGLLAYAWRRRRA